MPAVNFGSAEEVVRFVNGVAATGRLQAVGPNLFPDGSYIILEDGSNPAVTFYFNAGSFTPGGGYDDTNVEVDISAATDAADVATALETAINGAVALGVTASIDPDADTYVLLVNDTSGATGNIAIVGSGLLPYNFKVTGMDGGGGPVAHTDVLDIKRINRRWFLFYM